MNAVTKSYQSCFALASEKQPTPFAMPPLVSPRNVVCGTSAEIPSVLLMLSLPRFYPDLVGFRLVETLIHSIRSNLTQIRVVMGHQHGISALVPHADVDFRLSLLASLASFQYQLLTWTHCRNCVPVTLNGT